jgi:hypothetical protein
MSRGVVVGQLQPDPAVGTADVTVAVGPYP